MFLIEKQARVGPVFRAWLWYYAPMQKVGVIGFGYVGKALVRFFAEHYQVLVYDPYAKVAESGQEHKNVRDASQDEVNACELAVICVPTEMKEDGSVNLSIIEETLAWLATPLILLKSTVPPGTTEMLAKKTGKAIAFSPEYIGEGNYVIQWWKEHWPHPTDMKYHDFQIFGGEKKVTRAILQFFKKILGPGVKYAQTDATTAELTKYMVNSWIGTKVAFCNEFYNIAETFGVDYDELRELWLLDGRIGASHTNVSTDPKKRGFGGKCIPKDLNGIIDQAHKAGYDAKLLKEVWTSNTRFRKET
jgi:nucleotide sugar dehydrogenase